MFIAFCACTKINMFNLSEFHLLSFLEYLVTNGVSVSMLPNYISAAKANFTRFALSFTLWDHPNIKYFLHSIKINRPFKVVKCHVMDLKTLQRLIQKCDLIPFGIVYGAVFLVAYFGFLCLWNIAPHDIAAFDSSHHLTAGDIIFTKEFLKLVIKWSKPFKPGTVYTALLSPG